MQPFLKSFLMAAVFVVSTGLWAQEVYHPNDPDLMARLSYQRSAVVHGEEVRQICVAVSRNGDYRVVRSLTSGEFQRLRGKMSKEQLQELKKLLGSAEFRAVSGDHGGLIRQDSESFGAEIPLTEKLQEGIPLDSSIPKAHRLQWLNADGESPFPDSVAKVVDWLKHFDPTGGKSFEYDSDVCPGGGLRLLQPSVAENGRR